MNTAETVDGISKFLSTAKKRALAHNFDSRLTFRHAALLVDGNKVIATGFNEIHTSPLWQNPELVKLTGRPLNENHAEIIAVSKGQRKHDSNGLSVFVVRIHANGELANSRPCPRCQQVMIERGIKQCHYSISENEFGCMKLQNTTERLFKVR